MLDSIFIELEKHHTLLGEVIDKLSKHFNDKKHSES